MITRLAGFDPSINSFFNALIRELGTVEYRASHRDANHGCFVIHNELTRERLLVPCLFRAGAGRHTLGTHLLTESAAHSARVDFRSAVDWCMKLPDLKLGSSATSRQRFLNRVLNSYLNLRPKRPQATARNSLERQDTPMSFIEAEHALVHGHPLHPYPRDHSNPGTDERQEYTPVPGKRMPLAWYSVHRQQLMATQVGGNGLGALMANLFDPDGARTQAAHPPGHILVPCHPMQHRHWQSNPAIRQLQQQSRVRFLGMGPAEWFTTSSTQTMWSSHHQWMLRFSLSARFHGRDRQITLDEANRGPSLTRLLERPALRRWLRHTPHFDILREPVALSLCDNAGHGLDDTRMILRDNPFRYEYSADGEMLATLLQEDPAHGQSRLAMALARHRTSPRQWFQQFLDRVVDPMLEAQSRFGLLLSGHPQNLILGLDSRFLPERVWYRGAQDSVSIGPALASTAHRDHQRQAEDETAIRLFCNDLFADSIFNVIASLTRAELCTEGDLLTRLKQWLTLRRSAVHQDSRAMDYLLYSPCLFARSTILSDLYDPAAPDATTSGGPVCCPIPNPLCASPGQLHDTLITGSLEGLPRAAV